jgi:hypothetical protein
VAIGKAYLQILTDKFRNLITVAKKIVPFMLHSRYYRTDNTDIFDPYAASWYQHTKIKGAVDQSAEKPTAMSTSRYLSFTDRDVLILLHDT